MLVWLCHVSKSTYFTRFNHSFKIQLTWLVDLWPWWFGAWVELGFNKTPNKLIKFRTSLIFVLTLLLYYLEHISLFIVEEKEFYFWFNHVLPFCQSLANQFSIDHSFNTMASTLLYSFCFFNCDNICVLAFA